MHAGVQWYALVVAPRKEKRVAAALTHKGYECFLPLYDVRRVWLDRIKVTPVPLFSGYLFSKFDAQYRLPIVVTPGVREIVSTGRDATPVPDAELEAVRAAVRNKLIMEPCDRLERGDTVRVVRGALTGVEGLFVRYQGRDRLILSVSVIQRSVAVEIDRFAVEPTWQRTKMVIRPNSDQVLNMVVHRRIGPASADTTRAGDIDPGEALPSHLTRRRS